MPKGGNIHQNNKTITTKKQENKVIVEHNKEHAAQPNTAMSTLDAQNGHHYAPFWHKAQNLATSLTLWASTSPTTCCNIPWPPPLPTPLHTKAIRQATLQTHQTPMMG